MGEDQNNSRSHKDRERKSRSRNSSRASEGRRHASAREEGSRDHTRRDRSLRDRSTRNRSSEERATSSAAEGRARNSASKERSSRGSSKERSTRVSRSKRRGIEVIGANLEEATTPTVTTYDVATRDTTPITDNPTGVLNFFVKVIVVITIAMIAIFVVGNILESAGESSEEQLPGNEAAEAGMPAAGDGAAPRFVRVTFAGDCTLGTDENFDYSTSFNAAFEDIGDPSWFLANVADIFAEDDITIVNMEGTLTDSDERADKTFAFKGDPEYADVLSTSSVEAASMANNHSRDYGEQSFDDTVGALRSRGITTFGYDDIAYMDVEGVKVALIGTYELAEHEGIEESMVANINRAKDEGAELVLVYIHWGIEHEYEPDETQVYLGHAAIDAGADLVVGAHPHVIQGYEVYDGRYIVYSLGNFCFGGNNDPEDKDCMIFQQTFTVEGDTVEKNDDVSFIACSVSSTSSYNNYQPTPAEGDERDRIREKIYQIS